MKQYIISIDVGLTGFISLSTYDSTQNTFNVLESVKIQCEEKENFLIWKADKKKSKAWVKNQVSFSLNLPTFKAWVNKYNLNQKNCVGLCEQLTPRKINAQSSVMSLSDSGAICRALLQCFDLNFKIVAPALWKEQLCVTSDKETSINLFNSLKDKEIILSQKISKNHNQIESILIGYWFYKYQ